MKYSLVSISSLFIFSLLSINLSAQQFGPQFDNPGFEQWTTRNENSVNEPVHWHSSGTATGSFSGFLSSQIAESSHCRYGSTGTKSVRIYPKSVLGVTANGTLTNGRMNASSMSATGANNYNYTQRSNSTFNTPITQLPDSLTIWVCFRSTSTTTHAQVKAVIHGDADYAIRANGTEGPSDMHVATASQSFTRTAPANGDYNWTRLSIPFTNSGPCTDVRYILFMATTNENPGQGSTSDDLFVDDALLIYNPTLTLDQLASSSYSPNDAITIPFTLTGTMSPDNLNNAEANQVIAELSDGNGSFSNPTILGSVTTNTSGSITAQVPDVPDGQYQIRVRSTNYPMIGQNIQTVSISSPSYTISQTIQLSQGWNWCSFNVEITLDDLKAALVEAMPGTTISIKSRTQNTTYNPNNHRWNGSVAWNLSWMYSISVTADCEITVTGLPVNPAEHPVTIQNGANWIAFPLSESMSVTNAFAGFATNGDQVKSRLQNAQYRNNRWMGQLNALEPGKGYVYISNISDNRIFTFPVNAK